MTLTNKEREEVTNLPKCAWELRGGKKRGMPSKYELGELGDTVPICSLHFSRASTLGWPVRQVFRSKLTPSKAE